MLQFPVEMIWESLKKIPSDPRNIASVLSSCDFLELENPVLSVLIRCIEVDGRRDLRNSLAGTFDELQFSGSEELREEMLSRNQGQESFQLGLEAL